MDGQPSNAGLKKCLTSLTFARDFTSVIANSAHHLLNLWMIEPILPCFLEKALHSINRRRDERIPSGIHGSSIATQIIHRVSRRDCKQYDRLVVLLHFPLEDLVVALVCLAGSPFVSYQQTSDYEIHDEVLREAGRHYSI